MWVSAVEISCQPGRWACLTAFVPGGQDASTFVSGETKPPLFVDGLVGQGPIGLACRADMHISEHRILSFWVLK